MDRLTYRVYTKMIRIDREGKIVMNDENVRVLGDPWVFEVQEWLNKTYGNVSGFGTVPEDGRTGWPTIYGLVRAVQHELGITALANNFGPTTVSRWDNQVPQLLFEGKKHKIIKLIDGAMRCKGLGQGGFSEIFDEYTYYSITQFKVKAGFDGDNAQFSGIFAKALFDMSAFSLVFGGNSNVQEVQRYLNRTYYPYTGILPCDGIYQRDTNKALIYGLQAEMGMAVGTANGYFGEGTTANCPTLSPTQGTANNIRILQASLIVNDEFSGGLTGIWTNGLSSAVENFKEFMKIGDMASPIANMPVIKALLTTTGDINRSTNACDTSMQILTQAQVNTLKNAGYDTIGRYLTGTVGVGANEKPKNLTVNEVNLLSANGFKIFPIYQDGGWYYNYFAKAGQGWNDARLAGASAKQLGFKNGTTIYFACDFDVMGHEIATVVSYMRDVTQSMQQHYPEYNVSVYGPRNLCTQVMSSIVAINNCFVSDMSSGFSSNLGYKMPRNWSFDQYHEYILNGIPLDKVGMSGFLDVGQSSFNPPVNLDENNVSLNLKEAMLVYTANEFANKLKIFRETVGVGFSSEVEQEAHVGPLLLKLKIQNGMNLDDDDSVRYEFTNGKPELKFVNDLAVIQDLINITDSDNMFVDILNELGTICDNGIYKINFKIESLAQVGLEIQSTGEYYVENIYGHKVKYNFTITLGIFFNPGMFPPGTSPELDSIQANAKAFEKQLALYGSGLAGLALGGAFIYAGGVTGTLNVLSGVVAAGSTLLQKIAEFFSTLHIVPSK